MNGSDQTLRDRVVLGGALAVYAAIWIAMLAGGPHGHWAVALTTTAAYVGGHVFEITRRGHCFLSADATAFPVSLVVFAVAQTVLWFGGASALSLAVNGLMAYGSAFLLGHVAAHAFAFVADRLLPDSRR